MKDCRILAKEKAAAAAARANKDEQKKKLKREKQKERRRAAALQQQQQGGAQPNQLQASAATTQTPKVNASLQADATETIQPKFVFALRSPCTSCQRCQDAVDPAPTLDAFGHAPTNVKEIGG